MYGFVFIQSDAVDHYCQLVDEMVGSDSPAEATADSRYKEILVTKEGGLLTITLNRPNKYNAINYQVRK